MGPNINIMIKVKKMREKNKFFETFDDDDNDDDNAYLTSGLLLPLPDIIQRQARLYNPEVFLGGCENSKQKIFNLVKFIQIKDLQCIIFFRQRHY